MAKSPRQQTFADLTQEPTWSETNASRSGQYAPRPGRFNGDCTPEWVTHDQLRDLRRGLAPEFTGRYGAPTWIDVWANDHGTVVFAHGDVSWGNALT